MNSFRTDHFNLTPKGITDAQYHTTSKTDTLGTTPKSFKQKFGYPH